MSLMQTRRLQLWDGARMIAALGLLLCPLSVAKTFAGGPPPLIVVQPVDVSVPIGGTAIFTVVAVSGTSLSYQWYSSVSSSASGKLLGETSSTLTLSNVTAAVQGQYYVEVKNAGGKVDSSVATLTVIGDIPPVAYDDTFSTPEDTSLTVPPPGVLTNDVGAGGVPLSTVLVSNTLNGSLNLNADGSFTYTPDANYFGSDYFTYRASDGLSTGNVATVTLSVTPVNDPPVANADSYTTAEDVPLLIPASGVLANDVDLDGDLLSAVLVRDPVHGTLSLNTNGGFRYTPDTNYFGNDHFTYSASDGVATGNVATVTLTVTPINDPPIAKDDAYDTPEDNPLTILPMDGILTNDFDVEGDVLSAVLVSNVVHGSLSLNADGGFSYTPDTNYFGNDSFSYQASDGMATGNVATVTLTVTPVNDPPLAHDDAFTTAEDVPLSIPAAGVLTNDTDVDGDLLSAVLVSNVVHGTLSLNADGGFSYTPNTNYFGKDGFSYQASDGMVTGNVATVTFTVTPVNHPPVANNDTYMTLEDVPLTMLPADGVLTNDVDVDGNLLSAVLVSNVMHGTLNLNADGGFSYVPDTNYFGTDHFSYRASDGVAMGNVATATLSVAPVNDPPMAQDDAYTTAEDVPLTVVASAGILTNDVDVDGDLLSAVLVGNVAHGTLSLNADGGFRYTPDTNYFGKDNFSYRASDGKATGNVATVTLTVTPVNDPPVAHDDTYTTMEDVPLTILPAAGVLTNDVDVDGDVLSAVLVSNVVHGTLSLSTDGGFNYTPDTNYFGDDRFTYRASDGLSTGNVATVTLTVRPVNDPPMANHDDYTTAEDVPLTVVAAAGVLTNDVDVEGDLLSAVLVSNVVHGTLRLNADGGFLYTPDTNYFGKDSFSYRASDGKATGNVATVTLTVTPVNDPPMANDDVYTTAEDVPLTIVPAAGILTNDVDVDGDKLSAMLVSNVVHGTLSLSTNGGFSYTPNTNYFGEDNFSYQASDGSVTGNVATVTITVTPVNDPPVAHDDAYTTAEDVPLNILPAAGVLTNDVDVDGDVLSAVLVSNVVHGTLSLSTNGGFNYTPDTNYFGDDHFTYRASDGLTTGNVATVTLTIQGTAPLSLGSVETSTNGFSFELSSAPLSPYVIEASTNLTDWTPIFTNSALDGRVRFTDTNAASYSARFYRVVSR